MLKSALIASVSIMALAGTTMAAEPAPRPMFVVGHGPGTHPVKPTGLPLWNFTWSYKSHSYNATFVGTNPTGGASTTVPVVIIPMKLTVGSFVADPTAANSTGQSPVQITAASPEFNNLNYTEGGTNVGTTQYEDAFQRFNLWKTVKSKPGYHVLFGTPTIAATQSYTVPAGDGTTGTPINGIKVAEVDINWFDAQIQTVLSKLHIPSTTFPIFLTTQTYLTSSGCCIGGYHNYNGTNTYAHATFISNAGSTVTFSQDVSALSHEASEWVDDPLVNNTNIPALCGELGNRNPIYEVGDPLEVTNNYGTYPYVLNGVTYHLQDEVTPVYFGAPLKTTANGWFSFRHYPFTVCENGG